jgi:hypothetical protein
MKKLLLASLVVVLFAGMAMAQPADLTADVNVQVTVNGVWSITLDVAAVDFGTLEPGDIATPANVVATVRSNQKIPWGLQLNKDRDLTNDVALESIPSANFTYTGGGPGAGLWTNGEFFLAPTTAYLCAATEYKVAAGLALTTTLNLTIPAPAAAGLYTNVITYTLTATP